MPDPTLNLGLPKPEVNDEAWDDDYYKAMDILDKHPGVLVVETEAELPVAPFASQFVFINEGERLVRWSAPAVEWREVVGGRGGTPMQGHNVYGYLGALSPGARGLVADLVAPMTYRFTGFTATGTGDGYYTVEIDGMIVLSDRIDNIRRSCHNTSPQGVLVPAGQHVTLYVMNEARGTRQYEGTIFGEVENDG